MDYNKLIEEEIHKTHHKRNRLGYLPNPVSFFISIYFQRQELSIDLHWILALSFIVLGSILRISIGELFFEAWKKKAAWARSANFLAFLFLGIGWSLHFYDVHYHYGATSNNISYTLLIIAAFVAGSSTSLIGDKLSYHTFVLTLTAGTVLTFLSDPHWTNAFIMINITLYMIFSLSNFKLGHNQLLELVESQIRSNQESDRLKNIINTVPGFVGLMDKDFVCYMANQATLSLYPDLIGRKIGTLDPNSEWEKFVIEFMASGKKGDIAEQKTNINGEDLHVLLNVQKTPEGGAILVSIITTELVNARKKLREQEAKAQYSARLASLGEMAAGIAHEINNPLTIIQGSANILKRLTESEEPDKETMKLMANKIFETSDRISKTVKSLKALSRNGENDPFSDVSISHMLKICIDLSESRFKQSRVDLKFPEDISDYVVLGREVQLSQVLVNLLGNSLDAVKNLNEKWVEIKVEKNDNWIDVLVIDSGKGIPKDIQEKIMDPFFTTKDVNEGTGLGLSISKTILRDHGGELTLLAERTNTTFRMRLPQKETDS